MSPNFDLIAQMLGDYYDLQADGIVDAANRFPLGAIEEQITQLGSLQPVSNTTLANRIAELEREVSMHRNAEITWEKTMMQAVGEDGPKSVVEAFDKIKAERDALAAQVVALRGAKMSVINECLNIVNKNKTTVGASQYWHGTDITPSKFKENVIADLSKYADSIRQGVK